MNWISLEQLIKNNDINHVKTAVSWSFNDLSQYFGSDWNLALLPMGNSRLLTKVDNVYSFPYASDSSDSYFAIPLKQDYNVQGIRFKCSINFNSYNPLAQIRVGIRNSTFTSPNSETLGICYDTSVAQNCDYNTIDTIFHEYTKTISNYVGAYIVFTGIIGEISLKDIELYCDATTYTWQSVPSISGKNGILQSLVQIKEEALNDGEPVSEASVTSFDSLGNINIPSIIDEQMPVDPSDVTSVTATYLIPALEDGTYEGIKLLVKKNSIPTSEEDADKVIDLSEPTSILRIDSKSVGNLDEDSHYYFMIKLVDEIGTEATSDPKDIWTSHSEGYNFDYTGEIVEWTVPKTGIYSLETWGAQGGNATDGTNSARGGYGAYAYGEVLLTQGDKLYINVGGQNGYGGGGNADVIYTFEQLSKNLDFSHNKDYRNYSQGPSTTIDDVPSEYYGTDWMLTVGQMNITVPTYSNGTISLAKCASNMYCTGGVFMPIDRTYVKKLCLTLTINDEYRVSIGVGKIVSNEVEATELYYNTGTGSNIQLELDVNDDVDYLTFFYGQQAVTITDISFLC